MKTADCYRLDSIRDRFPMPADVRDAAADAVFDLNHGPAVDGGGLAFTDALAVVSDWLDEPAQALPVYYEPDSGYIHETEPVAEWNDDDPDDDGYWSDPEPVEELSRRDLLDAHGCACLAEYL